MEYIRVTEANIEEENICCAIASNNDCQVTSKKSWLKDRFSEGLVFLKAVERGKCFIEYIPAENAWVPIQAPGYLYIDCLWVSGKMKGNGYSSELLQYCIEDAKTQGKNGIVIISSPKKKPFLADHNFLVHKGFEVVDQAEPFYELLALKLKDNAPNPEFLEHIKNPSINDRGFRLYYTGQCPFTAKYVPLIEKVAHNQNLDFKAIKLESAEQAKKAPAPTTTYVLFYNGKYITNEILSEAKFLKIVTECMNTK